MVEKQLLSLVNEGGRGCIRLRKHIYNPPKIKDVEQSDDSSTSQYL